MQILQLFTLQLIWKRVKKSGHQVAYYQDDAFNALVRRISALPFTRTEDMDKAFALFKARADKLEPELKEFSHELISYAQTQWRERFAIQDWNLFSINCLLVPSTNNGNEGANGRFLTDFGVHPPFWNFCLEVNNELQRVSNDIPSILYGSQRPKENPLYHVLKEEREITKANFEAGLIDLDGYLGKMGAISLTTGKSFSSDEMDKVQKRKKVDNLEERLNDEEPEPVTKKRKVISAIPGRRGRPAKNIVKPLTSSSAEVSPLISVSSSATPASTSSVPSIPTPLLSHLPWPEQQGLQAIPSALPASSSRTTASAIPSTISSGLSSAPVSLSSIGLYNNSITEHINKYSLGLRERAPIPGDGNCWFSSNCDLARLYGLKSPDDPNELRLAVANFLQHHPRKVHWIRSLFNGKTRSFNRFIKEHSVPGKFIDNFGLFVLGTGEYLNVKYHIVGTSNNAKDPVTILDYAENSDVVMHFGYYQDNTDGVGEKRQAGHYQSLEPIPNKAIPCCKIDQTGDDQAVNGVDDNDVGAAIDESVVRNDEMISTEEKILKTFSDDHQMVELSLNRLTKMCVSIDDLFSTNISCILYNEIRPKYPVTSKIGKLSRKLLLRYQRLCRTDPEFDDELPNVTLVAEDEVPMIPKKKSFRSLFSARRNSVVIAQSGSATSIPEEEISTSARARASSTVIEQLEHQVEEDPEPEVLDDILDGESPVHLEFEPARRKSVASRKRKIKPPKSTIFERTDSQIILTPPPPTSPTTPPRRGRGRPMITSQVVLTPPPPTSPATPPRRGRGRPRKAITLDSITLDALPPPKKGRGRPKKL